MQTIDTGVPGDGRLVKHAKAIIAFDVDAASLASLQEAFPDSEIDCFHGATVGSLPLDCDLEETDLFVVGLRENVTEALGLCRFLAHWPSSSSDLPQGSMENGGRHGCPNSELPPANIPLLVLVCSGEDTLIGAALEAGARMCLPLPISANGVSGLLVSSELAEPPGRRIPNHQ